jgi:hypothetical protein
MSISSLYFGGFSRAKKYGFVSAAELFQWLVPTKRVHEIAIGELDNRNRVRLVGARLNCAGIEEQERN